MSALISFNETTQRNAPSQTTEKMRVKMKCRFGTRMTRLLCAMKSAEASITSIALYKLSLPQMTAQVKQKHRIPIVHAAANILIG